MTDHRSMILLVPVSILLVAVLAGSGLAAAQVTENASTHTLTITAKNGSASYAVTSSGSLQLDNGENSDYTVAGDRQIAGTVGKAGDEKDVIRYTGYIRSFEAQEDIQVRLNGRNVSPDILAGNHIKIIHPTNASGESINYHYPINGGSAEHGEQANQNDVANEMMIQGSMNNGVDSFYFTGEIPNNTFNGLATVQINGQPAEKFLNSDPPTPPATTPPTSTISPLSKTVTTDATTPLPTTTTPPPTATSSPPNDSGASDGGESVGLLEQIIRTIVVLVVLALIGIGAVLYLRR